jgi:hypothetical protein
MESPAAVDVRCSAAVFRGGVLPGARRRVADLVFLATITGRGEPEALEADLEARFVPLSVLTGLALRPPLAGHLRAMHERGPARTAACLGNLWRPEADAAGGLSAPPAAS